MVLGWIAGAHGPVAAEKAVTVVSHAVCAATRAAGGGGSGAGNRTLQQLGLPPGSCACGRRPASSSARRTMAVSAASISGDAVTNGQD